jgi:F-type H+-transporting ATPase subunit delta
VKESAAAARPYARALHALARERSQIDVVGRELVAVAELLEHDPEVRTFFAQPWVPAPAKRAVALEVAGRLGVSDLTRDFLGLVAQRGRAGYLQKMAEVFRELVDDELGRAHVNVRTAVPLNEADREALRQRLSRALHGKHVELDETVDHGLLGGFVAEVDSYIVDGSLDGQLARLRAQLAGG